uniref:Uncharacterized protein n=2 Tax=viral metagenome TaxID=1070528 RepID=A0A6M3IYK7_9ZZZZ
MRHLIIGWLIMLPILTIVLGINITDDISFGELTAIGVTILGGIIAASITFYKWKREKRRKSKLINFPTDKWKAYKRNQKGVLELQVFADVYIPFNSWHAEVITEVGGKVIDMGYKHDTTPFKRERCLVMGQSVLNDILQQSKCITVSMTIELDGEFKKDSEKATINIEDD